MHKHSDVSVHSVTIREHNLPDVIECYMTLLTQSKECAAPVMSVNKTQSGSHLVDLIVIDVQCYLRKISFNIVRSITSLAARLSFISYACPRLELEREGLARGSENSQCEAAGVRRKN